MAATKSLTDSIDMLTPISPVAHQVLELATDPESGAAELAEVIKFDPYITADLLRMCNSAHFGLAVQVDSVQHAVALLGIDRISAITIVFLASDCLKQTSRDRDRQHRSDWIDAVASAFMAKSIGTECDSQELPLLFTAALLRDVGLALMDEFDPTGRSQVADLVAGQNVDYVEAERAVFSIDHAVLGGMITDKWNLSGKLSHIISFHHAPLQGIHADTDTTAVYLADILCKMGAPENHIKLTTPQWYESALEKLGYTGYDVYRLVSDYQCYQSMAQEMLDGDL